MFLDTSETLGPPHLPSCDFECFRSPEPITGVTDRRTLSPTLQTIPTPAFSQLFYEHTDSLRNPPTKLPKNKPEFRPPPRQLPKQPETCEHSLRACFGPSVIRTFNSTPEAATNGCLGETETRIWPKSLLKTDPHCNQRGTCDHKNIFRPVN